MKLNILQKDDQTIVTSVESLPRLPREETFFWIGQYLAIDMNMLGEKIEIKRETTYVDFIPQKKNFFLRLELHHDS